MTTLIQDISRYQQKIDYALLKAKGQNHLIMKAGSGSLSKDSKFETHYAGAVANGITPDPYFWNDPIYDDKAQLEFFLSLLAGKKFGFIVIDFEQYWSDWIKWQAGEKGTLPKNQVPKFSAEAIYNSFLTVHKGLKARSGYKVVTYTAAWFLNAYCPQAYDYLKNELTHWADYVGYSGAKVLKSWEYLDSIAPVNKPIPTLPKSYPLDNVLMRQWTGDRFTAPGVYGDEAGTRLSDLDLNVWLNKNITIDDISKGGGYTMPIPAAPAKVRFANSIKPLKVLNVPYVPQIGEGANDYANDCGAASACMLVKAYTDNAPTVDEFYKATGQNIDAYLSASQIIKTLSNYGVGSKWSISNMAELQNNLTAGRPVICLVLYSVWSDAGITQSKFKGFHFVTAVGSDAENIYINDPLWNNEGGREMAIPRELFEKAWRDAGKDPTANPAYGCIIPNFGIGESAGVAVYVNYKVTATSLNVRSTPDSTNASNVIGSVKYNEIVQVASISNGWAKRYGLPGYVSASYLLKV